MDITVFLAQYGEMEGQNWANAQMLTDFSEEDGRAGCQVGKLALDTSNNNRLAKSLVGEIQRAQGPIVVKAEFGSKTQGGKIVSFMKSFTLLSGSDKSSSAVVSKPDSSRSVSV